VQADMSTERRVQWPWQVALGEWQRILRCVWSQIDEDHVFMVAAALAFYAVLALFPGLLALVSLYGMLANPSDVESFVSSLASLLPSSARLTLRAELHTLVSTPASSLSLGFLVTTVGALWSAASGVGALVEAVNLAYDKKEQRSFLRLKGISLALTLALMVFVIFAIALVAVLPSILALLGDRSGILTLVSIARWPLLAACVTFGLLTLYRIAPCRKRPRRWSPTGALLATVLWLGLSAVFSLYVSEFGSYNQTYGALGGIVVLLLWFYWSGVLVLIGAEVTAALEGEKDDCSPPAEAA
jgi:membrane protein